MSHITGSKWFRRTLMGAAFVGTGALILGAATAPAHAQYNPYYAGITGIRTPTAIRIIRPTTPRTTTGTRTATRRSASISAGVAAGTVDGAGAGMAAGAVAGTTTKTARTRIAR